MNWGILFSIKVHGKIYMLISCYVLRHYIFGMIESFNIVFSSCVFRDFLGKVLKKSFVYRRRFFSKHIGIFKSILCNLYISLIFKWLCILDVPKNVNAKGFGIS